MKPQHISDVYAQMFGRQALEQILKHNFSTLDSDKYARWRQNIERALIKTVS